MSVLSIMFAIIIGILAAFLVNLIVVRNIEKTQKIPMQVLSYFICILLCLGFSVLSSLHNALDKFIESRIDYVELKLAELLPGTDVMNVTINTSGFSEILAKLNDALSEQSVDDENYFETLVYNMLNAKIRSYTEYYINGAENIVNRLYEVYNKNNEVSIRLLLSTVKEEVLDMIVPYFSMGKSVVIFLFVVYIIVYICLVIYFIKGGTLYNKSLVFGDITYDDKKSKSSANE
jgi:Trk-type K+ transport system membrane component